MKHNLQTIFLPQVVLTQNKQKAPSLCKVTQLVFVLHLFNDMRKQSHTFCSVH